MNQPDHILNELREISPALAAIPRVNVFKVPDGYFEALPAMLLLQAGAGNMGSMQNASVPQGYFDGLADNIMARIKNEHSTNEDSPVIAAIGNKNIFTVPEGYFTNLAATVMSRIKSETVSEVFAETNPISETVARIGNKNMFTVPAGYFNELPDSIISKIDKPAKVVPMNSFRKFYKYAAAAVVTGAIAMSTVFIINKKEGTGEMAVQTAAVMDSAKSIIQTNSFDKEMASLSDADIVGFLESKGQDVDAALVASLTEDDKALPEADDYLFNENTLDEVLKDLDLNN